MKPFGETANVSLVVIPRLHLPRSPHDILVFDFPYDSLDIVRYHGLQRNNYVFGIHTEIVRFLAPAFVDILKQNCLRRLNVEITRHNDLRLSF